MTEDIARENPVGVLDGFMDNWTEDQRRQFNDDGLCELEQLVEVPFLNCRKTRWVKATSEDTSVTRSLKMQKIRGVFHY
jgi:hypothetical protein